MESNSNSQIILRGSVIQEDERGWICLDDLWSLAKAKPTQKPKHWKAGRAAIDLGKALLKKVRNSDRFPFKSNKSVIYAKRGRGNAGTYAHPIMAAAYAGYLDPRLEVEMREVWLRYRAGDASLADDILQRATAEANQWAGIRALSRARRRGYTDTLKAHGVVAKGYMECTEALYIHLLGGRSYQLRASMNLKPKANLRDHLPSDKLAYIMAAEALSAERIQEEQRQGNADCAEATAISAAAISNAVAADRRNRQRRLVP